MDTRKALTAIIILLIIMNITLGAYLVIIGTGNDGIDETLSYTRKILNDRNYRVDCRIPENLIETSSIKLGGNRYQEQTVNYIEQNTGGEAFIDEASGILYYTGSGGSQPVQDELTRIDVENIASGFISSLGIERDEFTLDYFRESGEDIYDLRYIAIDGSNNLYFNSYIELVITSGGIQSARIMYPSILEQAQSLGEGVPVYTILLANLNETGSEKSIESISYGYYITDGETGQAETCWRVRFGDGSDRYFNAKTGNEIK